MNTRYTFEKGYALFPIPDARNNLVHWYLAHTNYDDAMKCFSCDAADYLTVRNHIENIDDLIRKYEHLFAAKDDTATPKLITDEAHNYTGVKTLVTGHRYEAMHVRHNGHGAASFNHILIDFHDWSISDLEEILQGYGYNSLAEYLTEHGVNIDDIVIADNIDHGSPAWINTAEMIACFIAEYNDGRIIDSTRADTLAARWGISNGG